MADLENEDVDEGSVEPEAPFIFASFQLLPLQFPSPSSPISPSSPSTASPMSTTTYSSNYPLWRQVDQEEGSPAGSTSESHEKVPILSPEPARTKDDGDKTSLISVSPIHIATKQEIEGLQQLHPLPALVDEPVTWMRYRVFSLYRRLLVIVSLANLITLAICISLAAMDCFTFGQAATGTSVNLFAGTLMRHENYVNLVFWSITRVPCSAPLALRRGLAKFAYSQGGIHAGSGISAFGWLILYIILTCRHFQLGTGSGNAMAAMSTITGAVLLSIIVTAHPLFRNRYHNAWEIIHRYGGYAAIALVWAQIIVIAIITSTTNTGKTLIQTPAFWF